MTAAFYVPAGLASVVLAVTVSMGGQGHQPAKVGDKVPSFALDKMLNSDGRSNLDEFRGQPVLVDFWGTH